MGWPGLQWRVVNTCQGKQPHTCCNNNNNFLFSLQFRKAKLHDNTTGMRLLTLTSTHHTPYIGFFMFRK